MANSYMEMKNNLVVVSELMGMRNLEKSLLSSKKKEVFELTLL